MRNWYDEIAQHYDRDPFHLIGDTRDVALKQVQSQVTSPLRVMDLGCGTGDGLKQIQAWYPSAELVGIDLSKEMLALAQKKVVFEAIHDSLTKAEKYTETGIFDLVLVHYVMGFLPVEQVIPVASRLLAPGGMCSILTTTLESYQTLLAHCPFLNMNNVRDVAQTPLNKDEIMNTLSENDLDVVQHKRFERELVFNNYEDLMAFARDGGWLIQIMSQFEDEVEKVLATEPFPVHEDFSSEIMLVQKS